MYQRPPRRESVQEQTMLMRPETLLDLSSDTGVAPLSEIQRRVMAKYRDKGGEAARAPKKQAEPVLLARPSVDRDAPLTDGEVRAKAYAAGSVALQEVVARLEQGLALNVWHRQCRRRRVDAVRVPPKVRSVAAVKGAREGAIVDAALEADLPAALGGNVGPTELVDPEEELGSALEAEQRSRGDGLPSLEMLWSTSCDDPEVDARIFCVRYSPDGAFLAAGCADGSVQILHANSGRVARKLDSTTTDGEMERDTAPASASAHQVSTAPRLPTTSIRWTAPLSGRGVLVARADGVIERWQAGSAPRLLHTIEEGSGQQIYALDCTPSSGGGAQAFATAGKDTAVRLYDEATMTHIATFGQPDSVLRRYEGSYAPRLPHARSCVDAAATLPPARAQLARSLGARRACALTAPPRRRMCWLAGALPLSGTPVVSSACVLWPTSPIFSCRRGGTTRCSAGIDGRVARSR